MRHENGIATTSIFDHFNERPASLSPRTSVKEELVATRALSSLRLVSKLMVLYQPGGTHERSIILRLEEPSETTSPAEACTGLRKWMRWLQQASDIGLNLPDSTILMKGIARLSQKVLAQQPDLQFRCSLMRNTLQLDTIPTEETVKTYAEHLLAELEQLMHRVRPKTGGAPRAGNQGGGPQVKAAFVDEKKGEGNPEGKSPGICKYFRTDAGCRRGAACRWQHQAEPGEKRCYVCGAIPISMPRIALERRRISLELLVEMVARVMESVPIQSRRSFFVSTFRNVVLSVPESWITSFDVWVGYDGGRQPRCFEASVG